MTERLSEHVESLEGTNRGYPLSEEPVAVAALKALGKTHKIGLSRGGFQMIGTVNVLQNPNMSEWKIGNNDSNAVLTIDGKVVSPGDQLTLREGEKIYVFEFFCRPFKPNFNRFYRATLDDLQG